MTIRIVEYDYGFRIQELVTLDGLYIQWNELFSTHASALEYCERINQK